MKNITLLVKDNVIGTLTSDVNGKTNYRPELTLTAMYQNKVVGYLYYDINDKFSFVYNNSWIKDGFDISPKLRRAENIDSDDIRLFLDNLLPEGRGLTLLASFLKIDKSNIFSLLLAIGKDVSGAISFIRENTKGTTTFTPLNLKLLAERLENKESLTIWDNTPRLSLAGVQDKLPICILNGKMGFGEGDFCSTHIMKFNSLELNIVYNEFLCLQLASIAGLTIPNNEIKFIEEQPVLIIERFDREIQEDSSIKKIHVIDGCQALGFSKQLKYELLTGANDEHSRLGANLKLIKSIVNLGTANRIKDSEMFVKWVIVNLCLGNRDAHAKNISFYLTEKGIKLAPFYDIVNISLYKGKVSTSFAMAIGDCFDIELLTKKDIELFCTNSEIKLAQFILLFNRIQKLILNGFNSDFFNIVRTKNDKFVNDFIDSIKENIAHVQRAIDEK